MLSHRVLNRTLLQRQHLLARTDVPALAMTEHLLGLQAQETLPPYLSLWSRVDGFDAAEVSDALEDRACVRVLLMRGTIHLVTPRDALLLRPLVQPVLDKQARTSQNSRPAERVGRDELQAATEAVLADGPVTYRGLCQALGRVFPDVPESALGHRVRCLMAFVQVPPRGLWKQRGGVVYDLLESWLGSPVETAPDVAEVVRRYLRAFGPATPADVTTWSGVTGMRAVFGDLRDELVTHRDADGRTLFDLEDLAVADPDTPAPVRLLGRYDNVWLSHDRRDRVTPDPAKRRRWAGVNGGVGSTVFVDGMLEGLWRRTDSGAVDVELFRSLTRTERSELDREVAAVERFLAG